MCTLTDVLGMNLTRRADCAKTTGFVGMQKGMERGNGS